MTVAGEKRVRTCIGCGKQSSKGDLMRVVRTSDGSLRFDPSGRVAGRGAYACSIECFEKAVATGKLNKAFRGNIDREKASRVLAEMRGAAIDEDTR